MLSNRRYFAVVVTCMAGIAISGDLGVVTFTGQFAQPQTTAKRDCFTYSWGGMKRTLGSCSDTEIELDLPMEVEMNSTAGTLISVWGSNVSGTDRVRCRILSSTSDGATTGATGIIEPSSSASTDYSLYFTDLVTNSDSIPTYQQTFGACWLSGIAEVRYYGWWHEGF